jgi:hypothetical protein
MYKILLWLSAMYKLILLLMHSICCDQANNGVKIMQNVGLNEHYRSSADSMETKTMMSGGDTFLHIVSGEFEADPAILNI